MPTVTIQPTLQSELDLARPDEIADVLRLMHLGTMLTPLKRTFTGLTGAASFDLTLIDGTGETAGKANPNRVAALTIRTLRVTAATTANTVGSYVVTDAGGTVLSPLASTVVGLAKLSDDGKTLTFPTADVTAFIVEYAPRSFTDMTTLPSGSGIGTSP